jgi:hypothetical protein
MINENPEDKMSLTRQAAIGLAVQNSDIAVQGVQQQPPAQVPPAGKPVPVNPDTGVPVRDASNGFAPPMDFSGGQGVPGGIDVNATPAPAAPAPTTQPAASGSVSESVSVKTKELTPEGKTTLQKVKGSAGNVSTLGKEVTNANLDMQDPVQKVELFKAAKLLNDQKVDLETARAQTKLNNDNAKKRAMLMEDHKMRMQTWQQDAESTTAQIARMAVDPDKFWKDRGVGGRIAGALAMAMGAFASSYTGGPNYAMQIISQAVENDIMAQKDSIIRQQGVLEKAVSTRYDVLMQQYNDVGIAEDLARASSYEAIEANAVAQKAAFGIEKVDPAIGSSVDQLINSLRVLKLQSLASAAEKQRGYFQDDFENGLKVLDHEYAMGQMSIQQRAEGSKGVVGALENAVAIGVDGETVIMGYPVVTPEGVPVKVDLPTAQNRSMKIATLYQQGNTMLSMFANPSAFNPAEFRGIVDAIRFTRAQLNLTDKAGALDTALQEVSRIIGAKDVLEIGWMKNIPDSTMQNMYKGLTTDVHLGFAQMPSLGINPNPEVLNAMLQRIDVTASQVPQLLGYTKARGQNQVANNKREDVARQEQAAEKQKPVTTEQLMSQGGAE